MKLLQETSPIIFETVSCPSYFPQKVMTPVLMEVIKKATLPFACSGHSDSSLLPLPEEDELKSLCFFPTLPRIRMRRCYEADSNRKMPICTKKK